MTAKSTEKGKGKLAVSRSSRKVKDARASGSSRKDGRRRMQLMRCPKCSDTKGVCQRAPSKRPRTFFVIDLSHNFEEHTNIPCYARKNFLTLFGFNQNQTVSFPVALRTSEGFQFVVDANSNAEATTLEGRGWKDLVRIYKLQLSDELFISVDKGQVLPVFVPNRLLIMHPNYQELTERARAVADKVVVTDGTIFTWQEMTRVISSIAKLEVLMESYDTGANYDSCVPLVHTMTWTNVWKKEMKIDKRMAPQNLPKSGPITLVLHPDTMLEGKYTVSSTDGRDSVNGWDCLMELNADIDVGERVMLVFSCGHKMQPYLFVGRLDVKPQPWW